MKSFSSRSTVVALVICVAMASSVAAQTSRIPRSTEKIHSSVKRAFKKLTEVTGKSTIRIKSGNATFGLGTIVGADGWIVTKASLLEDREEILCVVNDKELEPTVVATEKDYDLALLKVSAKNLTPVSFAPADQPVNAGQFVVSVNHRGDPETIGVVSVLPRKFRRRGFPRNLQRKKQGYLGISVKNNPDGDGVMVEEVRERTAAKKAGLRVRDIVLEIGGKETNSQAELSRVIKAFKPNSKVTLKIIRADRERELSATLGDYVDAINSSADQWGGGPFSKRRFNFPAVIAHDSVLLPEKCGGPLINSKGQVVGINIARSLRVATYAVPAKAVKKFVDANLESKDTSQDKSK